VKIGQHEIDTQNLDKVFFPKVNLTKGDLINYYKTVADVMIPHMKRYGVSMQRFPDGLQGDGFYNKDTPDYFPDWIETVHFPKREGGSFNAPIVDSRAVLVFLADQGMITPHLYLSRQDDLEHPDKMIYDLDPPEGTKNYSLVRKAALAIRDLMDELSLKTYVQTTGSEGFHVIVPLDQSQEFDTVRDFAQKAALTLLRRQEDDFTLEVRKKKRKGRIFLDTLRNSYGATAVAPYAVRARPEASVATPVTWDEVEGGADPRDWTLKNIPDRLSAISNPSAIDEKNLKSCWKWKSRLTKKINSPGNFA